MTDPLIEHVSDVLRPDYDIRRELGRGGMAVVYEAVQRRDNSRVAIKVLPPAKAFDADARDRFVREARLAAGLHHPGIVRIYTAARRGDLAWYVMALVEGESLAARIKRVPRLTIDEARFILAEVSTAVGFAHDAGVVHRDIKPANILLDATTGRPIITDFGIARALEDEERVTADGARLGTPTYMAPELFVGDPDADSRGDIYSLGVMGYELLAGEVPFGGTNPHVLFEKHSREALPSLIARRPDAPPAMVGAIERALAKHPEDRWTTAADFRAALGGMAVKASSSERGASLVPPRVTVGRDPLAGPRSRRITNFRRRAAVYIVATTGLGVANVRYDPTFLPFLFVGAVCALDLLRVGARRYSEGISFRDLIFGEPRGANAATPTLPIQRQTARYETTLRRMIRHHRAIHRFLDEMPDDERAMVLGGVPAVDALHAQIQTLVARLRSLEVDMNVEADLTGTVFSRLEEAADVMRELYNELMALRDERPNPGDEPGSTPQP